MEVDPVPEKLVYHHYYYLTLVIYTVVVVGGVGAEGASFRSYDFVAISAFLAVAVADFLFYLLLWMTMTMAVREDNVAV